MPEFGEGFTPLTGSSNFEHAEAQETGLPKPEISKPNPTFTELSPESSNIPPVEQIRPEQSSPQETVLSEAEEKQNRRYVVVSPEGTATPERSKQDELNEIYEQNQSKAEALFKAHPDAFHTITGPDGQKFYVTKKHKENMPRENMLTDTLILSKYGVVDITNVEAEFVEGDRHYVDGLQGAELYDPFFYGEESNGMASIFDQINTIRNDEVGRYHRSIHHSEFSYNSNSKHSAPCYFMYERHDFRDKFLDRKDLVDRIEETEREYRTKPGIVDNDTIDRELGLRL